MKLARTAEIESAFSTPITDKALEAPLGYVRFKHYKLLFYSAQVLFARINNIFHKRNKIMRRLNQGLISFNKTLAFHKRKLHAKQAGKIAQKNNLVDNIGLKTFRGDVLGRNGSDEVFHGEYISRLREGIKGYFSLLRRGQFAPLDFELYRFHISPKQYQIARECFRFVFEVLHSWREYIRDLEWSQEVFSFKALRLSRITKVLVFLIQIGESYINP